MSICPSRNVVARFVQRKLFGKRILRSKKTGLSLFWKWLKVHSNYYRLHFIYFLAIIFIGSGIVYATQGFQSAYVDALFVVTSAAGVNGLMSLDVPNINVSSQIVLCIWMWLGSNVLLSIVPIIVRRFYITNYIKRKMPGPLGNKPNRVLVGEARLEYKALKKLIIVVIMYFAVIQLAVFLFLVIYTSANPVAREIVRKRGTQPTWWSMFYTIQGFQNCGFGALEDFHSDPYVLIILSFVIMSGNVAFPIFLRGIIAVIRRFSRKKQVWSFILEHPRRCFTHLFSGSQTRWLLFTIVAFIVGEMVAFLALDWDLPVLNGLEPGGKFLNAYFHAVSTRAVGWNAVSVSDAAPAMLIIWAVMMYISSYPVSLSVRASTISPAHEELVDEEGTVFRTNDIKFRSMVGNQAKSLLARDATLVFISIFAIAVAEGNKLMNDRANFTLFHIIFEVFSAYGTVGMSMGYPGNPASTAAVMTTFSKLVLCLVMILGRHRGLPDSIDHAVQLNKHSILLFNKKDKNGREMDAAAQLLGKSSPVSSPHISTRAMLTQGGHLTEMSRGHKSGFLSEAQVSPDASSSSTHSNEAINRNFARRAVSIDVGEFEYVRGINDHL